MSASRQLCLGTFGDVTRLQLIDLLEHERGDGGVIGVWVAHELEGLLKFGWADQVVVRVVEQSEALVHVHLAVLLLARHSDRLEVLHSLEVLRR